MRGSRRDSFEGDSTKPFQTDSHSGGVTLMESDLLHREKGRLPVLTVSPHHCSRASEPGTQRWGAIEKEGRAGVFFLGGGKAEIVFIGCKAHLFLINIFSSSVSKIISVPK